MRSKEASKKINLVFHNQFYRKRGFMGKFINNQAPGFHVTKSVKLQNLNNPPTLSAKIGILNQNNMNLSQYHHFTPTFDVIFGLSAFAGFH